MFSWYTLSLSQKWEAHHHIGNGLSWREFEKPGILNCPTGKETSNFLSNMTKTSTFPMIWLAKRSDKFLIESMFKARFPLGDSFLLSSVNISVLRYRQISINNAKYCQISFNSNIKSSLKIIAKYLGGL